MIIESIGDITGVTHYLAVPSGWSGGLVDQLQAAIPGIAIDKLESRTDTTAIGPSICDCRLEDVHCEPMMWRKPAEPY